MPGTQRWQVDNLTKCDNLQIDEKTNWLIKQRCLIDNLTKCDKVKMHEKVTRLISVSYTY